MNRIQINNRFHSATRAVLLVLLVFPFLLLSLRPVRAADLSPRSIRISNPEASATAVHTFSFYNPTAAVIGSIVFEYCDSPLINDPCIAPAGLNLVGSNITNQTGIVGFTKHPNSTVSRFVLGRVPAGALQTNSTYQISNVVNPSTANTTHYVRISIMASDDGTGPSIDRGSVAFTTTGSFNVSAYVPPFLIFCVGVTVSNDCSNTTGSLVSFGELSPNLESLATTQFAAATNDPTGYQVFLNGQTMTSGNNIIPPLVTQAGSSKGTSQFGLNLRLNTSPTVGSNPSGSGTAAITTKYDDANLFAFGNGDVLVSSTLPTDFNRFTQSYLVNVSDAQQPGVYATTLLYTAVASF